MLAFRSKPMVHRIANRAFSTARALLRMGLYD